jgi:hypothetical protein
MVVIDMVVGGEPVALYSCSPCDLRWWRGDNGIVPLAGVLQLATAGR